MWPGDKLEQVVAHRMTLDGVPYLRLATDGASMGFPAIEAHWFWSPGELLGFKLISEQKKLEKLDDQFARLSRSEA